MKNHLTRTALCLGLAFLPGLAAACPWAGGDYEFREHGIYGDFTVNADCTGLVWSRLSDDPEEPALSRVKDGWTGDLEKASFVLLDNGHSVRITDYGGITRQYPVKQKN